MALNDILYPHSLPVDRRCTTWIARRAIADWSGFGWLEFDASNDLTKMNPSMGSLRDLLAKVCSKQQGFQAFDKAKFATAWKDVAKNGNTVQMAYDAVWAGF